MSAASQAQASEKFIPLSQVGDAVPSAPLIGQDMRQFRLADFAGDAIALSFIYTRCQDARMCPLTSAKFVRAQHAIGTAPIRLLLLTLDPNYDTPSVLARYGRMYGQDARYLTLATGAKPALNELAGRFGIATSSTQPGVVVHTEAVVIIGPDGRLSRIIDGNDWSAAELIDSARAALPGSNDRMIAIRAWLSAAMERCGASRLALGGTAMLAVLVAAFVAVGGAFWMAFYRNTV